MIFEAFLVVCFVLVQYFSLPSSNFLRTLMEYVPIQCHLISGLVIVLVCNVEKQLDLVTNQSKQKKVHHQCSLSLQTSCDYISFFSVV